jgi:hypothetical protein
VPAASTIQIHDQGRRGGPVHVEQRTHSFGHGVPARTFRCGPGVVGWLRSVRVLFTLGLVAGAAIASTGRRIWLPEKMPKA